LVTDKDGYALNPLVMTKFWLHEGFSDAGTYELLLQSRCIITTSMCVAFSFSSHYGTAWCQAQDCQAESCWLVEMLGMPFICLVWRIQHTCVVATCGLVKYVADCLRVSCTLVLV
jgi:hypothetical protein